MLEFKVQFKMLAQLYYQNIIQRQQFKFTIQEKMLKTHFQEHKIKRINNNLKHMISPIPQKRAKISVVQPIFKKVQDHTTFINNQNQNPNIPENNNSQKQHKAKDSNRLMNFISKNTTNDHHNNDALIQYKSQCIKKTFSPKNRTVANTQQGKRILYLKHSKLNKASDVQNNQRVKKETIQQPVEQEHHSLDTFKCGFFDQQNEQNHTICSGRDEQKKRSITLRNTTNKHYQFNHFRSKEENNLRIPRNSVQLQQEVLNINLPSKRRQQRKSSLLLQNLKPMMNEQQKRMNAKFSFDKNMNSTQVNSPEKYESQKLSKNSSKLGIENDKIFCKYHSNKNAKYFSEDPYENSYLCSKCAVIQISQGKRVKQFNSHNFQNNYRKKKQQRKQRLNSLINCIDKSEPRVFKWATCIDELQQHFRELYNVELQKTNKYYDSLVQNILTLKKQTNEEIIQMMENMKDFFIISQRTINQYLQEISFMRQDIIPNIESITDENLLSTKDFETILQIDYKKLEDIENYQKAFSKSAIKVAELQEDQLLHAYNQLTLLRPKISIKGIILQKIVEQDRTFSFDQSNLDTNRPSPVFKGM